MKKYIFLNIFLMIFCYSNAQESNINNRWSYQLEYSRQKFTEFGLTYHSSTFINVLKYGYNNYFETGLYAGYDMKYLIYGVKQTFQILPLCFTDSNFRFELYIPLTLGGCILLQNNEEKRTSFKDYSIGLGFSSYIYNNWGVFTEVEIINRIRTGVTPNIQFGISYAWKHNNTKSNQ